MIFGSFLLAIRCRSSMLIALSRFMAWQSVRHVDSTVAGTTIMGSHIARPVVAPQKIGAELIEARAADLPHHEIDLADEDLDRLFDPGQSAGSGAIEGRASHKAEIGAEAERDQDIGAAPHATVEEQGEPVADRGPDRRQHIERTRRLVELAPAVVGDEDAVATDLQRPQCISRAHDALYDEGAREQLAVGLQVTPGLRVERAQRARVFVDLFRI